MVGRRRRVIWTDHAQHTLDEALAYIAQDSPDAAHRIASELIEQASTLVTLSERGRMTPELEDPSIRELLVRPFRLIYEVDPAEVRVLTIVHERRDTTGWKREPPPWTAG